MIQSQLILPHILKRQIQENLTRYFKFNMNRNNLHPHNLYELSVMFASFYYQYSYPISKALQKRFPRLTHDFPNPKSEADIRHKNLTIYFILRTT